MLLGQPLGFPRADMVLPLTRASLTSGPKGAPGASGKAKVNRALTTIRLLGYR